MTIIAHFWKETEVEQTYGETFLSHYTIPSGFVNVTKICKKHNKLWSEYKRLPQTARYLDALALDLGFSQDDLIINIQGGKNQGTWVHPEIGIDLAAWISVEFKVWANRTLRKVIIGEFSLSKKEVQAFIDDSEVAELFIASEPQSQLPKYEIDFAREVNRVWLSKDSESFRGLQHFINKFVYDRYPWEARFKIDISRAKSKKKITKHSYFHNGIPTDMLKDALGKIICLLEQCETGNKIQFMELYQEKMSDFDFWKIERGALTKVS